MYFGYCEPVTEIHCEFMISKELERHDYICVATGLNIDTKTHSISNFPKTKHINGKTNADVTSVHLHEQNVKNIPGGLQEIFPKMSTINIRNSSLTNISKGDFKDLKNMIVIVIYNSPIKEVPEDTFTGLSTLDRLELSACKIKTLHDKTFIDLLELKNLILSENEIEQITEFLFAKNTKLVEVNLIDNHIKFIAATAFDALILIESIWLTGNMCINENVSNEFELNTLKQKITERCTFNNTLFNTKHNGIKKINNTRHCNVVVKEMHMEHMKEMEKMQSRLTEMIFNETDVTTQKHNKVVSKFSYRFIVLLLTFVVFIIFSNLIYLKCFKVHRPNDILEHQQGQK